MKALMMRKDTFWKLCNNSFAAAVGSPSDDNHHRLPEGVGRGRETRVRESRERERESGGVRKRRIGMHKIRDNTYKEEF